MATATLAERVAIDLRLLIPAQRMIAMTQGPDGGATEDTDRTDAFSQMAAAKWVSRMGDAGNFDDADGTVGDQTARQWATEYAKSLMSEAYQMVVPDTAEQTRARLTKELEEHRMTAIDATVAPVLYDTDGEVVTDD